VPIFPFLLAIPDCALYLVVQPVSRASPAEPFLIAQGRMVLRVVRPVSTKSAHLVGTIRIMVEDVLPQHLVVYGRRGVDKHCFPLAEEATPEVAQYLRW
jgi:hypothetical protein